MLSLATPVENLTRVGKTVSAKLKRLGVFNVSDLLHYYPFRYDDFSQIKKIADIQTGEIVTVKGKIELLANKRSPRKKLMITECFLTDETGSLKVIWFGQPFIAKVLKNNDEVYLAGRVEGDLFNLYLKNPAYEKMSLDTAHTARLVPIYSLTEGLTQKQLRFLIKQALPLVKEIADWLPQAIRKDYQLIELGDALFNIHFPKNQKALILAEQRLKFNELLELQLQNQLLKKELDKYRSPRLAFNEAATQKIVNNLGFALTNSQKKCAWQILQDLAKDKPMNRLLEGDVGSGKTAVAALAIANCALNGYQTALLAPTEILATQHFQTLQEILKVIDCNIALKTAGKNQAINTADQKSASLTKAKLNRSVSEGEIHLTIGTHALLEEKVAFNNLALVIIDEQHRFGVEQRKALREKSGLPATAPHLLSMTATPIPRTLALTLYGDLELSVIDELPPSRKKPLTRLINDENREQTYDFILKQIKAGRQAFVICPLIEESDKLGVKAVTEEQQKLAEEIFPQLKIGLLHGRLKPKEKEAVMKEFLENKIQILVATSVVEVGVNVPNANVMIIEGAQRFGLAQLHQFRGRINRSHHQSYCFLFSDNPSEKSKERLKTLVNCYDGFKLAEEDLKQRGAGDLTGLKQSGFGFNLKIASLSDVKLIEQTKQTAVTIIKDFPDVYQNMTLGQSIHPE